MPDQTLVLACVPRGSALTWLPVYIGQFSLCCCWLLRPFFSACGDTSPAGDSGDAGLDAGLVDSALSDGDVSDGSVVPPRSWTIANDRISITVQRVEEAGKVRFVLEEIADPLHSCQAGHHC